MLACLLPLKRRRSKGGARLQLGQADSPRSERREGTTARLEGAEQQEQGGWKAQSNGSNVAGEKSKARC
uniref:Uncharacterized protein n=1 Tax=Arundo donax TaxID=35708 RepID=A0A0A8Y3J6_ARUDO